MNISEANASATSLDHVNFPGTKMHEREIGNVAYLKSAEISH